MAHVKDFQTIHMYTRYMDIDSLAKYSSYIFTIAYRHFMYRYMYIQPTNSYVHSDATIIRELEKYLIR